MGACNGKSVEEQSAEEKPMEEKKESEESAVESRTSPVEEPDADNEHSAPGPDEDEIQKANGTEVVSEEGHTPSPADNRKLAKSKSRSRRRGSVRSNSCLRISNRN